MERDLLLMCRNACQFNEPGSQIYKDAKMLKKIIASSSRKQESSNLSSSMSKLITAPSTRSKRGNRGIAQSLINQTASLPDEDDESDDEEDDPAENEADDPQWLLFQTIRTVPNSQGIFTKLFFLLTVQVENSTPDKIISLLEIAQKNLEHIPNDVFLEPQREKKISRRTKNVIF